MLTGSNTINNVEDALHRVVVPEEGEVAGEPDDLPSLPHVTIHQAGPVTSGTNLNDEEDEMINFYHGKIKT